MIENIKLQNYKGINLIEIKDLEHINVFCGRNNSGKTTIFEAIQNKPNIGKKITDDDIEKIIKLCFPDSTYESFIKGYFEERRDEILKENKIWYRENAPDFQKWVLKIFQNPYTLTNVRVNYYIENQKMITYIENIIPEGKLNTAYLPAKRIIKPFAKFIANPKLNIDDVNFLNYLFFCKNQLPNDPKFSYYKKIQIIFEKITNGFNFEIIARPGDEQIELKFSNLENDWYSANNFGIGLIDVLLILTFSILPDNDIIIIEEPENHLHPEMQRNLLKYLISIEEKQFFISTHGNVFLDNKLVDKIYYTYYQNKNVYINDATSKAQILQNIGYSINENLTSDLIILTEGPKDKIIIEHFMIELGFYFDYNIKIWPLGGDIMNQLDLEVFSDMYNVIALIDNDPESSKVRNEFMENCQKYNIHCHKLHRYSIENYYTLSAIKVVYGEKIPASVNNIKPKIKVDKQIGFSIKRQANSIVQNMSLLDIADTDLYSFLLEVKKRCENN